MKRKALALASPVLAAVAGLLAGRAIRAAGHGHPWHLLAILGAIALAGSAAALLVPYLAGRRALLRYRAFLLEMRAALPGMVEEAMREPDCIACGDTGEFLSPDADGESVTSQACPYCLTPYPVSAGDPGAEAPY